MKLALYQMKMSDSIQDNFQKSMDAIEEAAEHGADLILIPTAWKGQIQIP